MPPRVLDLFAGIGGFSLGLERAGFETVAFCEANDWRRRNALQRHWPDVPIWKDIRDVTSRSLRAVGIDRIDVVTGGFPCQPFSVAGQRRGTDDDRHLWPEMARVIEECRPAWVIGENTPGLINLGLDGVLSDLEGIGYAARTFVVPAAALDAPHRRDRVWIVANRDDQPAGAEPLQQHEAGEPFAAGGGLVGDASRRDAQRRGEPGDLPGQAGGTPGQGDERQRGGDTAVYSSEGVGWSLAPPCGAGPSVPELVGEPAADKRGEQAGSAATELRCTHPWGRADQLCGGDGKLRRVEPGVRLLAHGVSERVARVSAFGDAVVPQIPEVLGRAILEAEVSDAA